MTKTKFTLIITAAVVLITAHPPAFSQAHRILAEGEFDDWEPVPVLYTDASGDQLTGDLDFGVLKIANDEKYLFIYFETAAEISLQNDNEIHLYLDTDNDENTGHAINGIGAELNFTFGDRSGTFYTQTQNYSIYHEHLTLVTCPTVTSDRFEVVIARDCEPAAGQPLFTDNQFRIVITDGGPGADQLPENGEFVEYTFDDSPLPPLAGLTLAKIDTSDIRVLSYNVLRDALFDPVNEAAYERIFNAIQPEIIGFQEIYDHTSAQTAGLMEDFLPSEPGQTWHHAKTGPDIIVVSRYPILQVFPINGNGAFLLDLTPRYDSQLLLINAHLPAGSNDEGREDEIDNIMAFLRDAKAPGGVLDLEPQTPVIIIGDMNLVGFAQQLETFLTGSISQISQYGPQFDPDWDGSDLADLIPRHPGEPHYFTWYSQSSSFSPGRLDFFIYSDYVLDIETNYVLFTPWISPDTLSQYNLQPADAETVSDHVPVVADFRVLFPPTPPVDNVVITIEDEDIVLTWTAPLPNFGSYNIYRSQSPYFVPSQENLVAELTNVTGSTVGWQDSDLAYSGINYFYLVVNTIPGE